MSRVFAVAMQKGGVGKTSATVNLAAAVAGHYGLKTLVVDFDSQCDATFALTGSPEPSEQTVAEVIWEGLALAEATIPTPHHPDLMLVPGSKQLAVWEKRIREDKWENLIRESRKVLTHPDALPEGVDVVFFDTPPSLGLWLQAALAAADGVVVVTHCSVFSAKQLHDLVHTVETIRQRVNPSLAVDGLIVNEVRPNTTLQSEYVRSYREAFGSEMLEPVIPMRTVVGEAQQNGIPIEFYGDSKASEVRRIYRVLAGRLLDRAGLGHGRLTAAAGGAGKRTVTAATE